MFYIVCVRACVCVQNTHRDAGATAPKVVPEGTQSHFSGSCVPTLYAWSSSPKGNGTPPQVSLVAGPTGEGAGQPGCITVL